eukprot:gene19756-20226_t
MNDQLRGARDANLQSFIFISELFLLTHEWVSLSYDLYSDLAYAPTNLSDLGSGNEAFDLAIAFNPFGHMQIEGDNEAAHVRLGKQLRALSPLVIEGAGIDPAGVWPAETSYFAIGIDEENSRLLGCQYNQDAVVWVGPGGFDPDCCPRHYVKAAKRKYDMSIRNGLFSSESVSEGHPDKLADRISDRVLDAFLERDLNARVACETLLADQCVIVAGEFKTRRFEDYEAVRDAAASIVRQVLRDTGYRDAMTGIDPDGCEVQIRFNGQSQDINQGVDRADGILGAGDQGLVFGYASNETAELMPAPILYSHRLVRRQAEVRKNGSLPWLQPDAKSQVTFRYADGRPIEIETVVLSTQHDENIGMEELRQSVQEHIIDPVIPFDLRATSFRTFINPTGRFVTGGPKGDAGLTGRKIIVDTYGGAAPHGGGAFSGKDPSKVDRSAAYMARFLAKQIVARNWAQRALVQIAYAIGIAEPVSFAVETFGTETDNSRNLAAILSREFDLRPQGIIDTLNLKRTIYYPTAAYGHFGRTDLGLPWEAIR